jgi:hypothetical protein
MVSSGDPKGEFVAVENLPERALVKVMSAASEIGGLAAARRELVQPWRLY